MGNLQFVGSLYGINMNNQQYLVKDSTFSGCNVGINIAHCFDCIFQNSQFPNCGRGIDGESGLSII